MLKEFKEFALKGNVIDLAIAVIIGMALGKIISSLVEGILMPLICIFMVGVAFAELEFTMGDASKRFRHNDSFEMVTYKERGHSINSAL